MIYAFHNIVHFVVTSTLHNMLFWENPQKYIWKPCVLQKYTYLDKCCTIETLLQMYIFHNQQEVHSTKTCFKRTKFTLGLNVTIATIGLTIIEMSNRIIKLSCPKLMQKYRFHLKSTYIQVPHGIISNTTHFCLNILEFLKKNCFLNIM